VGGEYGRGVGVQWRQVEMNVDTGVGLDVCEDDPKMRMNQQEGRASQVQIQACAGSDWPRAR
jgi:hypothetical protein